MSWVERSIGEITEVVTKGTTPSTYGMPFTDTGINFVKAEALNGDVSLDRGGFAFINEETYEKLKRSQLKENDVLVTIAGANVGKCGYVYQRDLPANTNQAVGIVRVKQECANPRYIYYHFKNPSTFAMCQGIGGGQAAQPNINLTILKSFKLPLPDVDYQNRVVQIISAYDDLIENNKRRIELLEDSARQLYKEWFMRFRFPGHEHVKIIDSIPEGWKRLSVAECCEKPSYGYTASADVDPIGPKFLRITDIVPNSIDWPNVPHCLADDTTTNKYILSEGDIVVARTGATVGYAKRMPELNEKVVYASYLVRFRPNSEILDDLILGIFMESEFYKEFVRSHAGGAAQPNANAQILGSAKIIVPTKLLQNQFREIVETLNKQKTVLENMNFSLINARNLLLPKLMSGEIAA